MRLQGKAAFVTGAGKGIGRAVALLFAREGAQVALFDRDHDALADTQQQISTAGGKALSFDGDVSDAAAVQAAVDTAAERFGGLDFLVANAGVAIPGSVVDISLEDWQRVLGINLNGVFHVSKYGIPHLIRRGGGSVINVASTQGWRGFPGWSGYSASKGAIIALSRQVSMEYAGKKVRCNSIAPGAIDTPMNEWVFSQAADPVAERAKWDEQNPLGRIGLAEDVANAALYLASDESSWVTGICLTVDGGQLAGSG